MAQNFGQLNPQAKAALAQPQAGGDALVQVRQLRRSFGARTILNNVDLDIRQGEFVALLGRSGSGKSTFLRALAGLDATPQTAAKNPAFADSGSIAVPAQLAVVFQDARLLPWRSVLDNVIYGLRDSEPRQRGIEMLEEVGLAGREKAWPGELSGGEQQRVALARALVRSPQLLLADEPFGALDALTRIRMHALLARLCQRHQPAVLLVTHDVDEAIELADRILVLDEGQLSIDVSAQLPNQKTARLTRAAELRQYLLEGLGVRDSDDDAASEQTARKAA